MKNRKIQGGDEEVIKRQRSDVIDGFESVEGLGNKRDPKFSALRVVVR